MLGHVKHDTADAPTAHARMRFINRSHREGPLGSVLGAAAQDGDDLAGGVAGYRASGRLLEQYPLVRSRHDRTGRLTNLKRINIAAAGGAGHVRAGRYTLSAW